MLGVVEHVPFKLHQTTFAYHQLFLVHERSYLQENFPLIHSAILITFCVRALILSSSCCHLCSFFCKNDHEASNTVNVGGLEEVQSNDPAVMKSTSLGSLDNDSEHIEDLLVKVDDPEKHIEGYVSYFVLTKVRKYEQQYITLFMCACWPDLSAGYGCSTHDCGLAVLAKDNWLYIICSTKFISEYSSKLPFCRSLLD